MIISDIIFISFRVYLLVYVFNLISVFIFVVHPKLTRFSPQSPFNSGSEMDLFGDLPEPTNDPGGLIKTNIIIIIIFYALKVLK